MELFFAAIIGFILVGGGLLSVIVSTRWLSSDQVSKRLSDYVRDETSSQVSGLSISAQTPQEPQPTYQQLHHLFCQVQRSSL